MNCIIFLESVDAELPNTILDVKDGKRMPDDLIQSRIKSKSMKFHDKLKRCMINTFKALYRSIVKCKHFQATVNMLPFSIKHISAALTYPLSSVPESCT